jgi:hypothetical protein
LKKQATTWLIVAAASFVLCGGNCFGLIGGILAFLAMQAADQGNVEDAESKLKWAKIVTIAGGALALIGIVSATIWYVVMGAAALAGH